ncbi:uncharacterized protein FOMMEDRAFT_151329 [Fomitiporia mediterranea MF3/22]|uniref:uncharacterized protein n=1 Tax=Fomitiporia mediterranea (strain MF3/22) TaxID=694068 RepID=UPI0004409817|nr:uncharacterized protein FOMMEDRAFT_151329 [Fomitiporia mediterranea MF3/22]EJD08463.1 hypothetical protein FOMMEDRAFT_151329 [Fomitiporia mediterranea MF3/22]
MTDSESCWHWGNGAPWGGCKAGEIFAISEESQQCCLSREQKPLVGQIRNEGGSYETGHQACGGWVETPYPGNDDERGHIARKHRRYEQRIWSTSVIEVSSGKSRGGGVHLESPDEPTDTELNLDDAFGHAYNGVYFCSTSRDPSPEGEKSAGRSGACSIKISEERKRRIHTDTLANEFVHISGPARHIHSVETSGASLSRRRCSVWTWKTPLTREKSGDRRRRPRKFKMRYNLGNGDDITADNDASARKPLHDDQQSHLVRNGSIERKEVILVMADLQEAQPSRGKGMHTRVALVTGAYCHARAES